MKNKALNADPIAARACKLRRNVFGIGDAFTGTGASARNGLIHAQVHIDFRGTCDVGNGEAAAGYALSNGTITASVTGPARNRFVPAANGRIATVHCARVSIVAVSGSTGLAGAAAAVVTDRACIVVVAGHRCGRVTARSL